MQKYAKICKNMQKYASKAHRKIIKILINDCSVDIYLLYT